MRPVLWYLAFVGVPILALIGILRIGANLTAPQAVHGQYALMADSSGGTPCVSALSRAPQLTVRQSGTRLDIRFGDVTLKGEVVGDSLTAVTPIRDGSPLRTSCQASDSLRLAATRAAGDTLQRLVGTFLFDECATCGSLPFQATRTGAAPRGG